MVIDTSITSEISSDQINEYHLKNYVMEMYNEVLLAEHNGEMKNFVVRIYSRIFNASQIQGAYEVNIG